MGKYWKIGPQEGINLEPKISNDSVFRIAIARVQDNFSVSFSLADDEILENRSSIDYNSINNACWQ